MRDKAICMTAVFLLVTSTFYAQEFRSEKVFIRSAQQPPVKAAPKIEDPVPDQFKIEEITREATYFGLIIGVNNYNDPAIASLENPIDDAQELYNLLTTKYTFAVSYTHLTLPTN